MSITQNTGAPVAPQYPSSPSKKRPAVGWTVFWTATTGIFGLIAVFACRSLATKRQQSPKGYWKAFVLTIAVPIVFWIVVIALLASVGGGSSTSGLPAHNTGNQSVVQNPTQHGQATVPSIAAPSIADNVAVFPEGPDTVSIVQQVEAIRYKAFKDGDPSELALYWISPSTPTAGSSYNPAALDYQSAETPFTETPRIKVVSSSATPSSKPTTITATVKVVYLNEDGSVDGSPFAYIVTYKATMRQGAYHWLAVSMSPLHTK